MDRTISNKEIDIETKLNEKFDGLRKVMGIENKKRRKEQLVLFVGILFPDEIDYLYENRRKIREKVSIEFSNEFYLFEWMKDQNIIQYHKFKEGITNVLKEIGKSCNYCDFQIKHLIAYTISRFLDDVYVK
jgi:hypothetical protein